ncbi:helix-turn-helix domain-containing protein [Cellulosimicrobium funkei]|uniref:helix-turn-helix domain-containing protein n=1 Tax=Cellulosimicrobium funkei TaxID=264251 RepID=UPI003442F4AA
MNIDELLGFDASDPRDRLAEYIMTSDDQMLEDLVARRKAVGLKQEDVALRMGIDKSGVSRIESGLRDLQLSTLRRYAMAIDAVVKHEVYAFEDVDGTAKARRYFEGTRFQPDPRANEGRDRLVQATSPQTATVYA